MSHHGPLYECHVDQDDNYRDNIRWKRSDLPNRMYVVCSELSDDEQRKFPKKTDPSNHFSGIWKCDGEQIEIVPPADNTMYDGWDKYADGDRKYKISYWFNNFAFAYYPENGTVVMIKSDDGRLYQKGRTEDNTLIDRGW